MKKKQWLVISRDGGDIFENETVLIDQKLSSQHDEVRFVLDHKTDDDEDHDDIVQDMMTRKTKIKTGWKVVDEDIIYYILDIIE